MLFAITSQLNKWHNMYICSCGPNITNNLKAFHDYLKTKLVHTLT